MDAIDMLTKDHEKVRELFRRFRGGGGLTGLVRRTAGLVDPRERRAALAKICDELTVHTRLEESVFYPAVRALGDSELTAMVKKAVEEHAKVKRQVQALRKRIDAAEHHTASVERLEADVEHHAGEEEREMFPRVNELTSAAERTRLARGMQALKRGALSRASTSTKRVAGARRNDVQASVPKSKPVSRALATPRAKKARTRNRKTVATR